VPNLRTGSRPAGFSLVELMVGLTLGLMLIAGAVTIYLATSQSYREVEQVAALTENARFAEQIVGESLRHMGFLGEVTANKVEVDPSLTAPTGDCSGAAGAYNLTRLGYAATVDSSGAVLGCITDGVEGTDVLVIKRTLPRPFSSGPRVRDPNDPPTGTIDTPGPLEDGRTYVMSNSVAGRLFEGSSSSPTEPTIGSGGEFPGGTAWEYQYEVFYVRQANSTDVPRLSRRVLSYNATTNAMEFTTEDIVEGVEDLQLLFGYDSDSDGDVDTYEDLAAIEAGGNWANVASVEVFMLVRSATSDAQYTDQKTYRLGDPNDPVGPFNDNFRRLLSHTSVSLRNLKLIIRGGA
jgi:type IV pilus assembly protein PilW